MSDDGGNMWLVGGAVTVSPAGCTGFTPTTIAAGATTFALASAPLFQDKGLPFVTSGATSPDLPDMVGGEMFLACFGDDVQAHAMAEYAYKTLGVHNIVIWTDNANGAHGVSDQCGSSTGS